eukprot:COSAG01_NODE_72215_length_253_cov_1.331169_1_plen_52_part_01
MLLTDLLVCWQRFPLHDAKGALAVLTKLVWEWEYENSVCHVASTVAVKIDYR